MLLNVLVFCVVLWVTSSVNAGERLCCGSSKSEKFNKLSEMQNIMGLHIFQWNCNGLFARKEELLHHIAINKGKYHVICLQETFLKPGKMFDIQGIIL